MKTILARTLLAFGAGLVATAAIAAGESPYVGGKIGPMMHDNSSFKDATNIGAYAGVKVLDFKQNGSLSAEAEITTTISKGKVDAAGASGKWDVTTVGGYAVYRTDGDVYFKGKAGLNHRDVSASISGVSGTGGDFKLGLGVGGGWKLDRKIAIEIEFTHLDSDINYLSAGALYRF
jgi:hypothetical protein